MIPPILLAYLKFKIFKNDNEKPLNGLPDYDEGCL